MRSRHTGPGARTATLFASALLLLAAVCESTAAAAPERYTQGLLWKVEAPGVAPSYVFGTMHVSDPRVTRLPRPVQESFDSATAFAMEVTPDKCLAQIGKRMVYTGKRSLPAALGQPLYDQLVPVAVQAGVPREILPRIKPWLLVLVLSMAGAQGESRPHLDHQLYLRARAQKKPVYELETVSEAIAPFANLSEGDQIVLLRDTLGQHALLSASLPDRIDTYLRGDLAALARLSEEFGEGPNSRLYKWVLIKLIDERNVNMARRMDMLVKAGGAFMALGALHLYGEKGVLALLEKRGHRVTRVH